MTPPRLAKEFQLQMLLGELLLLVIAALDAALRATKVLRLSVDRPRRPSAEQFAKQQKQSRIASNAPLFSSPTSTSTTRTAPAASAAAAAARANGSSALAASPPPPPPERDLDAVIIGGGAAGVSTAAALARAGLARVAVLERHAAPGDVWRTRYAGLTLHDIADDCALPFVGIPSSLPVYLPAGVFADYLDFHARIHRVDFRGGVLATSVEPLGAASASSSSAAAAAAAAPSAASSPEEDQGNQVSGGDRWRVRARPVSASGDEGGGGAPSSTSPPSPLCFETRNVIFCDGGLYNSPRIPAFAREAVAARAAGTKCDFLGEVVHSSQLSAREGSCARFAGKRVLVVGFGNSAMDVVQELVALPARAVIVAVRDPSRRAVVPLLAYGAYQEQLARYPWLLWADRAATFLEARSVASRGVLKSVESGGCGGGGGDDDDGSGFLTSALSPLFLLLAAAASALAPLLRSLATGIDLLLDAATAARSLRAWAALGARGGDLSPYGLSALPGGKGDCGPVTWTKRTANVLVMDTGAVKEVIRGNARVVVAAVERLGPGKRVELRPTPGAVAAVPSSSSGAAAAASSSSAAASAPAEEDAEEEPRLPSSASPATAALLASVGGEVPGGEAPVLKPAPRFLDDIDAVILCTGFDTMQQAYGLVSDPAVREALGGAGAAGYLVPPEQRGTGVVASGRAMPAGRGLDGLWFVFGRLTQVRDGALEVARMIVDEGRRRRGRGGKVSKKE